MKILAMLIGALVLIGLLIYGAYCAFVYIKGNKYHE